jgi:hypothetical protein
VLEFNFNWDKLSAIAGLSWKNFYFRLYEGSITSERVIEFLGHLQRHVPGKLLIVWDGASIHRSKLIREYVAGLHGKIWMERLPAYAPELNPVEYLSLPRPGGLPYPKHGSLLACLPSQF